MKKYLKPFLFSVMLCAFILGVHAQNNVPTFTISVNGNEVSEVCLGISLTFTCTSNNTNLTWDFGDGTTSTSTPTFYSYKKAGSYTVTLKDNTTGLTSKQTLKVNSIPSAKLSISTNTACTGNAITFTSASTSDSPITLYRWDFGDGSGKSTSKPTIEYNYNSAGNFIPNVTVSDENGCSNTSTNNTAVNIGSSGVDVAFQANGQQFYSCDNNITFSNTTNENGKTGIQYVWDMGDNTSAKTKNPGTHTYNRPGAYTVTLKASYGGNTGCSPGFSKTIYVGKPSININTSGAVCALAPFDLNASANISGFVTAPSDLKWQVSNGTIARDSLSATFKNVPGSSQITVTNVNGCPSPTTKDITVKEIPNILLATFPNTGICTETVTTTKATFNNNTQAIQTYKWTPGDGSPEVSNTIDSFRYQYTTPGSYKMGLQATNVLGCSASANMTIVVNPDCIDNGYGSTYNPVFGFYSKSCEDKYTITIFNKNPDNKVSKWVVDSKTVLPSGDSGTVSLSHPLVDSLKNKTYQVQTFFQNGKIDTKTISIINEQANFAFVNTENSSKYCANNNFVFRTDTSFNVSNIATLNWTITNQDTKQQVTLKGNNPKYVFPAAGRYTVSLTITDITRNACTSTINKPIEVKGMTLSYEADSTSFCDINPTITFHTNIVKSNAAIQSVRWSLGDGTPAIQVNTSTTDTTFKHQYLYNGSVNSVNNYTTSVVATDADGCKTTVTKSSYIKIYHPVLNFNTEDTMLCNTNKIIITNTSNVTNGTYLWRVGDVEKTYKNRSEFNNTFDNISLPSTMDLYLQVTDLAGGCVKDTLVKNYLKFAKPVASFDILNKELLQQCPPYGLLFKNNSTDFDSAKWTITNANVTSTFTQLDSLYFTIKRPGQSIITLESTLDGCKSTTKDTIMVKGPIANLFLLDTVGCTPFTSRMRIEHNDNVVGYQWDFGDSTEHVVSTDADSLAHTYKIAGNFTPKVIVLGAESCTDELTYASPIQTSFVSPAFESFNLSDKCTLDTPKFLNTTKNSVFPIQKFIWNWGDSTEENLSRDTLSHLFSSGVHKIPVSLTAVTDVCTATSDTVFVTISPVPSVFISGNATFCNNENLQLAGLVNNISDSSYTYSWYDNQNKLLYSGKDSLLQVPMTNSGTNSIKLSVTTEQGCSGDATKDISILEAPVISAKDSIALCAGDSIQIQAVADGKFAWTSQERLIDGNTASPILFPNKNAYYYLSVIKDNGCISKDSVWAQVDRPIGATYENSYKACLSDTAAIEIKVHAQLPTTYTWTASPIDNAVTNITDSVLFVNPYNATTYHFVAHSSNVCPDENGDITVQYSAVPTIHFAAKVIEQPAGTIFTLNPTIDNLNGDAKYTWYPDFRLDNRFLKNPTVIADKDTSYILQILDEYGCTTSDTVSIKVLCDNSKILMANAFTPNGDGKNDRFYVTGYGIKNVAHLLIIDRWGKKVFEKNNMAANDINQGWDGTINGRLAEPGTYLYIAEVECTEGNKIPLKGSVVLIR